MGYSTLLSTEIGLFTGFSTGILKPHKPILVGSRVEGPIRDIRDGDTVCCGRHRRLMNEPFSGLALRVLGFGPNPRSPKAACREIPASTIKSCKPQNPKPKTQNPKP